MKAQCERSASESCQYSIGTGASVVGCHQAPPLARKLLVNRRMSVTAQSIGTWDVLNRNVFFVKSAVKRLAAKTSDKFDIHDPNARELVLECREPGLNASPKRGGLLEDNTIPARRSTLLPPFRAVGSKPFESRAKFRSCPSASLPSKFTIRTTSRSPLLNPNSFPLGARSTFRLREASHPWLCVPKE